MTAVRIKFLMPVVVVVAEPTEAEAAPFGFATDENTLWRSAMTAGTPGPNALFSSLNLPVIARFSELDIYIDSD